MNSKKVAEDLYYKLRRLDAQGKFGAFELRNDRVSFENSVLDWYTTELALRIYETQDEKGTCTNEDLRMLCVKLGAEMKNKIRLLASNISITTTDLKEVDDYASGGQNESDFACD